MDDVLRCQSHLDWAAHRHVQLVDLALAFRILDLPHPLLSDCVNVHRVGGRAGVGEEDFGAPPEERQHDQERNHGPGYFQTQGAVNRLGDFVGRTAAIFDGENEDRDENQGGHDELTTDRYQYRWSTLEATEDAATGKNGMGYANLPAPDGSPCLVAAEHEEYKGSQCEDGGRAEAAH